MAGPKPVYVSKAQIREAFNAHDFPEKIRKGEVSTRVEISNPAPSHLTFWQPGTMSRLVVYVGGNGTKLATVHEYRLPDGSIGASGFADPKRLVVGEELWIVDPNDHSD